MKKYLGIGSCRVLTPLYYLNSKDICIYNSLKNWYIKPTFQGNYFIGKLYNTKEIIQLIELLLGKITLSNEILSLFLTSFSSFRCPGVLREKNPEQIIKNIKDDFNNIDKVFIEVSSIKCYKYKNKYVFLEHISSKNPYISNLSSLLYTQDKNEIIEDLEYIIQLIGSNKIIFVSHFNISGIKNRLIIKESLEFVSKKYNIPLILPYEDLDIKNNKYILKDDLLHYSLEGIENIKNEYKKYLGGN